MRVGAEVMLGIKTPYETSGYPENPGGKGKECCIEVIP
jgi:hypothetical protein